MSKRWIVALLALNLSMHGRVWAAQVNVGNSGFTYGHNYISGGNPLAFGEDYYEKVGGFFSDNNWYLSPGEQGYIVYKFQAVPGAIISAIDLKVQTYFEAGSWLSVFYRTTGYTDAPDFSQWTNLSYSYGGYHACWMKTFQPAGNVVYVAYRGGNLGSANYQFQLQKDQLDMTLTALEPGDANGDGKVNDQDANVLTSNYGMQSGSLWADGDFTGDGKVDDRDVEIVLFNYGYGMGSVGLYVDEYFQWKGSDWPAKVKSDENLVGRITQEDQIMAGWGVRQGIDPYGGSTQLGWQETPSGFFRVVQRQGYYWLITPQGNPCFYIGLSAVGGDNDQRWPPCPVTGREDFFQMAPAEQCGEYSAAWMPNAWNTANIDYVLPITANLIRKYGDDWRAEKTQRTFDRMKAWGFSGGGKWCYENAAPLTVPRILALNRNGVSTLVSHPDIFDLTVCDTFENVLKTQCESCKTNPWLVGLSFGNEDSEMFFISEIQAVMRMVLVPAKRALVDYAYLSMYNRNLTQLATAWGLSNVTTRNQLYAATSLSIPAGDLEQLRRYYEDRYYSFIYTTVKKYEPNHLFFGYWTPSWRVEWNNPDGTNPADWNIVAQYCDVIGYDHYDHIFARPEMLALINSARKPVFVGEFGWGPDYGNQRGFLPGGGGDTHPNSDAEVGTYYTQWLTDAANNPYCVGVAYFQQHDQPCIGQGPGQGETLHLGESCAWGLIDVTDTPKWDLVNPVRTINLQANTLRLNAMNPGSKTDPK